VCFTCNDILKSVISLLYSWYLLCVSIVGRTIVFVTDSGMITIALLLSLLAPTSKQYTISIVYLRCYGVGLPAVVSLVNQHQWRLPVSPGLIDHPRLPSCHKLEPRWTGEYIVTLSGVGELLSHKRKDEIMNILIVWCRLRMERRHQQGGQQRSDYTQLQQGMVTLCTSCLHHCDFPLL